MSSEAALQGLRAAGEARQRLGIGQDGPVPDLVDLIEQACGIPISILPLPEGIAGAYGKKSGREFIFVSSSDYPVRRRFTLAHEFGHHCLGHDGVVDPEGDIFGRPRNPREVAANSFAANFLAPETAVRSWLIARGKPSVDLELVVRLAVFFRISAKAALIQLHEVDRLPGAVRASLDRQIADGDHKQLERSLGLCEEVDTLSIDRIAIGAQRLPSRMTRNARTAFQAGLVTAERLAELLGTDAGGIAAELGPVAPDDSFADY
jgi:Zn-dependent peptidase ImmA (M78 family)